MDVWNSLTIWWTGLNGSEQASWVQAVGSIVAILIAIAIPFLGGLIKAWQDRKTNRERMLNALVLVHDPIDALWRSLDEFYSTSDPGYDHDNPLISTDPSGGKFEPLIPAVMATAFHLNDLDSVAPQLRKLLVELMEFHQFWRSIDAISASGSPGFYRNNQEDIRERIKSIIDQCEVVRAAIDKKLA